MGKSQYARKADNNKKRQDSRKKVGEEAKLKSLVTRSAGKVRVYESLLDEEYAESSETQRNSNTDSRWVCADYFFGEGCRERKCRRNHDIPPLSGVVTSVQPTKPGSRSRSKSRSSSMSESSGVCLQKYTCLSTADEKKSWKRSGEVVYVVIEGAIVYNRDSGGFVSGDASVDTPPRPPPGSPLPTPTIEEVTSDFNQTSIAVSSSADSVHFSSLPEFVLGHILTFVEDVGDFGRVSISCKINLEIFTSPPMIQIINRLFNWPLDSSCTDAQALYHTRNNLAHRRLLIALLSSDPIQIDPNTHKQAITKCLVHKNSIIIPGVESLCIYNVHRSLSSPVHVVRAAPFKKDVRILDFDRTDSHVLTLSTLYNSPFKLFLTSLPLLDFLCGEGLTASSPFDSLTDILTSSPLAPSNFLAPFISDPPFTPKIMNFNKSHVIIATYSLYTDTESPQPNHLGVQLCSEVILLKVTSTTIEYVKHIHTSQISSTIPIPFVPPSASPPLPLLTSPLLLPSLPSLLSSLQTGFTLSNPTPTTLKIRFNTQTFTLSTSKNKIDDTHLYNDDGLCKRETSWGNISVEYDLRVGKFLSRNLINGGVVYETIGERRDIVEYYLDICGEVYCGVWGGEVFVGFFKRGAEEERVRTVKKVIERKEKKKKRMEKKPQKHDKFARGQNRAMNL
ncbi:hypothetical protein TrVE_jg12476 [Triparma verrucosa]|uniref:C3H1-type domain-containing protein n=1 Tax=Triparma verrucosa TaxID=1606542 RepID=A0A9W7ERR6_9STRA|nr:hypothetical protein TrVE_jg12476 [Triparma verrucosa]